MDIKDLIIKKRDKKELNEEELQFFIQKYFKEEILEEQAAALLTLMYTNGITEKEMAYLSTAMAETGEEIEIYKVSNKIVDIHAIGGIQDKLIIIINSILNALGIPSCKIAGRELGMTDRLSSIQGFDFSKNVEELKNLVNNNGIAIIKEPIDLAPIENKLYRLRNVTACNDCIPLIAMSIMSQKIAIGARNIVFDITCGENAYVKNMQDARKLAKYLVKIGNNLNRNIKCLITEFNEPIGKYFGNSLEIQEIIDCLHGKMTSDMADMVFSMGSSAILESLNISSIKESRKMIEKAINTGEAYNSFLKLILGQGGKIEEFSLKTKAKNIIPVISTVSGYISGINIAKIREAAIYSNAIRGRNNDILDVGAGIEFCRKTGDKVKQGEILAFLHTNDDTRIQGTMQKVLESFEMSAKPVKARSRILEIVG